MKDNSRNPQGNKMPDHMHDTMRCLLLHNDDINSFERVMEILMEVCEHDELQAEQCTLLAHYKGACEVVRGPLLNLMEIQNKLITRGLIASIE